MKKQKTLFLKNFIFFIFLINIQSLQYNKTFYLSKSGKNIFPPYAQDKWCQLSNITSKCDDFIHIFTAMSNVTETKGDFHEFNFTIIIENGVFEVSSELLFETDVESYFRFVFIGQGKGKTYISLLSNNTNEVGAFKFNIENQGSSCYIEFSSLTITNFNMEKNFSTGDNVLFYGTPDSRSTFVFRDLAVRDLNISDTFLDSHFVEIYDTTFEHISTKRDLIVSTTVVLEGNYFSDIFCEPYDCEHYFVYQTYNDDNYHLIKMKFGSVNSQSAIINSTIFQYIKYCEPAIVAYDPFFGGGKVVFNISNVSFTNSKTNFLHFNFENFGSDHKRIMVYINDFTYLRNVVKYNDRIHDNDWNICLLYKSFAISSSCQEMIIPRLYFSGNIVILNNYLTLRWYTFEGFPILFNFDEEFKFESNYIICDGVTKTDGCSAAYVGFLYAVFSSQNNQEKYCAPSVLKHVSDFYLSALFLNIVIFFSIFLIISFTVFLVILLVIVVLLRCCFQRNKLNKIYKLDDVDLLVQEEMIEKESVLEIASKLNSKLFEIKYEDIKMTEFINQGGSMAAIFLGEWEGKKVAVKLSHITELELDSSGVKELEREMVLLLSLNHPNIIKCYGAVLQLPKFGYVMEFAKGDLKQFFSKYKENKKVSVPIKRKLEIVRDISFAMRFLHEKNIIHRDLKCENVLITESDEIKITDFGLSRLFNKKNQTLTKNIGTAKFMSPEMVMGKHYDLKTDVFSFGVMLFEIFCEIMPYLEDNKVKDNIEFIVANDPYYRPNIGKFSDDIVPGFIKILAKKCWEHVPKNRPIFTEIVVILEESLKIDPITLYIVEKSKLTYLNSFKEMILSCFTVKKLKELILRTLESEDIIISIFVKSKDSIEEGRKITSDEEVTKIKTNSIIIVEFEGNNSTMEEGSVQEKWKYLELHKKITLQLFMLNKLLKEKKEEKGEYLAEENQNPVEEEHKEKEKALFPRLPSPVEEQKE